MSKFSAKIKARSPLKLTLHTIRLVEGDLEKIQQAHPNTGANLIIRNLVHSYVKQLEAKLNEQSPAEQSSFTDIDTSIN